MKKVIAFLLLFSAISMLLIQACKKNEEEIIQPNQSPVAFAGNDTTFLITNCEPRVVLRLDGHKSYDPERNSTLKFLWKQVSGPVLAFIGVDTTQSVAYVYNLVNGEYEFELEVSDVKGLSAKDSIVVNVNNITDYQDLELDIAEAFVYEDNIQDYYDPETYNDIVSMYGDIKISNESFYYAFTEYADSAKINTQFTHYFNLSDAGSPTRFIYARCTVDFDSLYAMGGGAFNGAIIVTSGSAYVDCDNTIQDIPQIQITGNLNAASKTITMKIKGKIIL